MNYELSPRKKYTALLLSLLLHLALMWYLIHLKHEEYLAPALAQKMLDQYKHVLSPKEKEKMSWVSRQAQPSNFGASVIFQDDPEFKKKPAPSILSASPKATQNTRDERKEKNPPDEKEHEEKDNPSSNHAEFAEQVSQDLPKEIPLENTYAQQKSPTSIINELPDPSTGSGSSEVKSMTVTPPAIRGSAADMSGDGEKDATPITLADITKGFLQQLANDKKGTGTITVYGNGTGAPTIEQLKYERYLQKLTWWIQNSDRALHSKLYHNEPVLVRLEVLLGLERNGKLRDLYVVKSSGIRSIDEYILLIFKDAADSFPPVPSYIKEDPFKVIYIVTVRVGPESPFGFSLNRR